MTVQSSLLATGLKPEMPMVSQRGYQVRSGWVVELRVLGASDEPGLDHRQMGQTVSPWLKGPALARLPWAPSQSPGSSEGYLSMAALSPSAVSAQPLGSDGRHPLKGCPLWGLSPK